jgi:hypothetical protein
MPSQNFARQYLLIDLTLGSLVPACVFLYTAERKRSEDEFRLFPRRTTWLT